MLSPTRRFSTMLTAALAAVLVALIDDAEDLIGDRNLIAHALWARDADNKLHILKYKGGKKQEKRVLGEPVPMEEEEIENIQDRIMTTCLGFMNWVEDLIDARKSSQEKPA